jgi:hypothetical protein
LLNGEQYIPQYEAAVKMVENQIGAKPMSLLGKEIPPQFRHLAISIHAEREDSVLSVTFIWGVGFPLKHTAYVYISSGELPQKGTELQKDWSFWERINDHWFIVGD